MHNITINMTFYVEKNLVCYGSVCSGCNLWVTVKCWQGELSESGWKVITPDMDECDS